MPSLFSRLIRRFSRDSVSSWQRQDVVFAVMLLLVALLATLLAVDGYALYVLRVREAIPVVPAGTRAILTERDIDDTLQILNEREEKMKAVLGGE